MSENGEHKEIKILDSESEKSVKEGMKLSDELYERRERYRHKAFTLALELVFLIGVPAFAALIGGKAIDAKYETGMRYTFILLGVAFVLSWTMIIIKYIKFSREAKKVDQEIREVRKKR